MDLALAAERRRERGVPNSGNVDLSRLRLTLAGVVAQGRRRAPGPAVDVVHGRMKAYGLCGGAAIASVATSLTLQRKRQGRLAPDSGAYYPPAGIDVSALVSAAFETAPPHERNPSGRPDGIHPCECFGPLASRTRGVIGYSFQAMQGSLHLPSSTFRGARTHTGVAAATVRSDRSRALASTANCMIWSLS